MRMSKFENPGIGIGRFLRQEVLPPGMSVTDAAKRLGVSRQALSRLLNGKASLSPEMTLRLEKTFGTDRERLLDIQSASMRDRRRNEDQAVPIGVYVPNFITITAKQIENWAKTTKARDRLPVLLRGLVHSTGRDLCRVDFPGFDNAQRHGWDGWVEAEAATPWVPKGNSGWECGVGGQRPRDKAELDYRARLRMLTSAKRANCTFVFVTARNWPAKNQWADLKNRSGDWKAVRAYDASDVEQWLETSVAPRIWLAKELGVPTANVQVLEECWNRWVRASDPRITSEIFAPSVARHHHAFREWLVAPPNRPFTVAADSKDEALALIACLLRSDDLPSGSFDQAVLFESVDTLRLLGPSSSPFIPIVCSQDIEREIGEMSRLRHCIVVRPRNSVDREPDVATELLSQEAFEKALADMGITERERIIRLARESGRSPTILRRRLSTVHAIRKPIWAEESAVRKSLIPLTLVGAWHSGSSADREVLAALADSSYEEVEEGINDLRLYDDCPIWCVNQYCGVVSKIDALFAVAPSMTRTRLTNFVDFAEYVLSELDPSLELHPDQRWMAGIYGKVRKHSEALRTGICETLVLLAIHGDTLFRERLGVDVEEMVNALVRRLLTPLTSRKLLSHDHDLPSYAEAAPAIFLTLLEEDLKQPEPESRALLKPVGAGFFERPMRIGLVWALERLAWNPQHLLRVVLILADLSRTTINDNWGPKPITSLASIFRSWIPQTAATIDERISVFEVLCQRFPDVGWKVCIQQFRTHEPGALPNNRPRWRSDAAAAGEPISWNERSRFVRRALDLAIEWPTHDGATLGDLVASLGVFDDGVKLTILDCVDTWSRTATSEGAKAQLRERIRCALFTSQGRQLGLCEAVKARATKVYERLAPRDPVTRHAWLFADTWIRPSADEEHGEDCDWEERHRRIDVRRVKAMTEIWSELGLDGAIALLPESNAESMVGRCVGPFVADECSAEEVLRKCLSTGAAPAEKVDRFLGGFIESLKEEVRNRVLSRSAGLSEIDEIVRLLRCAPFGEQTWRLVDQQPREVSNQYWTDVVPAIARGPESERNEIIDRLLEFDRPRAAFFSVQVDWDMIETSRLKRLLLAIPSVDNEPPDHFNIAPYDLSDALRSLGGRPGVTLEEMAQLEFVFIRALHDSEHGTPNLEKQIAKSPSLFVQLLALAFRRSDGAQDPEGLRVNDPAQRNALVMTAHELFHHVKYLPGTNDGGEIEANELMQWVTEARRLCREFGRIEIGDQQIGQWLSRETSADGANWPCRAVCKVLEEIASNEMATGFEIGVYNNRGVTTRGSYEGGRQERDLASKYRAWAEARRVEYPFVSRTLESIADSYEKDAAREDSEVRVRQRLEQ